MNKNLLKTTQVAPREDYQIFMMKGTKAAPKVKIFQIINRITGEKYLEELMDYDEVEAKLDEIYDQYLKCCYCLRMEDLLHRSFPFERWNVMRGYFGASEQMRKDWKEFERIGKEFCDIWNNAPTKEEAEEATERLRRYYNSIWYIEIELDGEMWKYIIDYDTQLPLFRQISDGCLCKVDPKFDEEEDVMYYTLLTELGNHEYLDRYIEKMRNNSE